MKIFTRPQPHVPAPERTPPPRGPGVFVLGSLLALSCACSRPALAPPPDPAARALDFLKRAQAPDGSFAGGSLSAEVSTAFVLGLLSTSELPAEEIDSLLNRAAGFLLKRQLEDGSFGENLTTGVCVVALSTYGRRLRGLREPEELGVEAFERAFLKHESGLIQALGVAGHEREDVGRRARDGQRVDGGWPLRGGGASDVVETAIRLRLLRLAQAGFIA